MHLHGHGNHRFFTGAVFHFCQASGSRESFFTLMVLVCLTNKYAEVVVQVGKWAIEQTTSFTRTEQSSRCVVWQWGSNAMLGALGKKERCYTWKRWSKVELKRHRQKQIAGLTAQTMNCRGSTLDNTGILGIGPTML